MNLRLLLLLCALVPGLGHAQGDRLVMKLYPHGPSESNGLTRECWIKDFTQLRQVCDPSLTVCFPEKGKANGQAVVVCPGGGYSALAIHHEGFMVADWLNSLGITAVVLKYRMPNGHHQIPLKDAQTALEIVRRHARKWHINSDRIGIMGFSAGGHLASTAATHFTSAANRPAFAVLVYPVVTMGQYTHKNSRKELLGENPSRELIDLYSNEKQVTSDTPPLFIVFSEDDKTVNLANGVQFYEAAKAHNVPAELHFYPTGGHGWSFRDRFAHRAEFRALLSGWLERQNN